MKYSKIIAIAFTLMISSFFVSTSSFADPTVYSKTTIIIIEDDK